MESSKRDFGRIRESGIPDLHSSKAKAEARAFKNDSFNTFRRDKALYSVSIVVIWSIFLVTALLLLVWLWHLLAPATWQWLTEEQSKDLSGLITTGILGGVIGKYFDSIAAIIKPTK